MLAYDHSKRPFDQLIDDLHEAMSEREARRKRSPLIKSMTIRYPAPKKAKRKPTPRVIKATASPLMVKCLNKEKFDSIKSKFDSAFASGSITGLDACIAENMLNKAYDSLANQGRI